LGIGPNPQSPKPNTQKTITKFNNNIKKNKINILK